MGMLQRLIWACAGTAFFLLALFTHERALDDGEISSLWRRIAPFSLSWLLACLGGVSWAVAFGAEPEEK
jgi:hypothetical protein